MRRAALLLAAAWLALAPVAAPAQTLSPDSRPRNGNVVVRTGPTPTAGQGAVFSGPNTVKAGVPALLVNSQSGTSYTIDASDYGKLVILTSTSSNVAVTLPQATGSSFGSGFYTTICSYGRTGGNVGVTITPTTSNIAGMTSYVLNNAVCAKLVSDGTNYQVEPLGLWGGTLGGFSLARPDGTSVGGNQRGLGAVDLQTDRNAAAKVCSGTASFCAGQSNTGSGNNSVAMGVGNTASGSAAFAVGTTNTASNSATVALGDNNTASGVNSAAIGQNNTASGQNSTALGFANTANAKKSIALGDSANTNSNTLQWAYSAGNTNGNGPVQWTENILWAVTSGTAATRLTADGAAAGAANVASIPSASVLVYRVQCVLHDETNQRANTYSWDTSLITRSGNASTTALSAGNPAMVAGPTTGTAVAALVADPAITADTTNGGFNISFTPNAGNTARLLMMCRISGLETDN